MKRLILIILALFTLSQVNAQSRFSEGYVITNENDTIHGLIKKKTSRKAGEKCVFKNPENKERHVYYPGEIRGYAMGKNRMFLSKKAQISNYSEKEEKFLEVLIQGVSSIYFIRTGHGDMYFIEKEGFGLTKLPEPPKYANKDSMDLVFQKKLSMIMEDCPQIQDQIKETELNAGELTELAKDYHDMVCEGGKCTIYKRDIEKVQQLFGLQFGVFQNAMDFQYSVKSDYSLGYELGLAYRLKNVLFNSSRTEIRLGFLLNYSKKYTFKPPEILFGTTFANYNGTEYKIHNNTNYEDYTDRLDVNLNLLEFRIPIEAQYFFPIGKTRLGFGLGLMNRITLSYSDFTINIYESQYHKTIATYLVGFIGSINFIVPVGKNEIELGITTEKVSHIGATNQFLRLLERRQGIRLAFYF